MCDGIRTRAHSARARARLTLWSLIKFHLKTKQRWLQLGFYRKRVGVALQGCEAPSGSFAELFVALFWRNDRQEGWGGGCMLDEGDKRLLASQGWFVCEWASVHVCEVEGGVDLWVTGTNASVPRWRAPSQRPDEKGQVMSEHGSGAFIIQEPDRRKIKAYKDTTLCSNLAIDEGAEECG